MVSRVAHASVVLAVLTPVFHGLPIQGQPTEGDLVLSDTSGDLTWLDWPNGTPRTLVTGLEATGIAPLPGNESIACHTKTGAVVIVEADGTVTPMAQLPALGGGRLVLDQNRSLVASAQGAIYRVEGPVVSLLFSQAWAIDGLDRHDATGDFVLVDDSTNSYTLDRLTGVREYLGAGGGPACAVRSRPWGHGVPGPDRPRRTGDAVVPYPAEHAVAARRARQRGPLRPVAGRRANDQQRRRREAVLSAGQPTSISSTWKTSVSSGPIAGGAPRLP